MFNVIKVVSMLVLLCGSIGIGSIEAASKSKNSSKSDVPSELKKIGYFETLESEAYDSREALQLN